MKIKYISKSKAKFNPDYTFVPLISNQETFMEVHHLSGIL